MSQVTAGSGFARPEEDPLYGRCLSALLDGRSKRAVEKFLAAQGYSLGYTRALMHELLNHAREVQRSRGTDDLIKGGVMCVLGGAITWVTYSAAAPGGAYIIMTGLLVIGTIYVVRGVWRYSGAGLR